jgi:hypothetical protein
MARRKNPPSDTTLYIALAAAGAALYYFMSPKAAAKPPVVGDNPFGPPDGGPPSPPNPPDGALPDGFMPTDRARQLQRNLNLFWWPEKTANLATEGAFGPATYAALEFVRPRFLRACELAKRNLTPISSFFADSSIFVDFFSSHSHRS